MKRGRTTTEEEEQGQDEGEEIKRHSPATRR
jgi:hypothetical protein